MWKQLQNGIIGLYTRKSLPNRIGQLFQTKSHLIQVPKDKKELAGEKGE